MGIGSVARAWLLKREKLLATPKDIPRGQRNYNLRPKQPHFAPKAKAMISLFMHGGPSHMDLTDPKPHLSRFDGTDYSGSVDYSFANEANRKLFGSVRGSSKNTASAAWISANYCHTLPRLPTTSA